MAPPKSDAQRAQRPAADLVHRHTGGRRDLAVVQDGTVRLRPDVLAKDVQNRHGLRALLLRAHSAAAAAPSSIHSKDSTV